MIKWYLSKFDSWFNKQTKDLDISDEGVQKATPKDYWLLYKIINSPMFWLFMLPLVILLGPFIFLFSILYAAWTLVIIAAGVSFLISMYMILTGQGTPELILLCIGSGMFFIAYVIGGPLMRKSSWYANMKHAIDQKIQSWLWF